MGDKKKYQLKRNVKRALINHNQKRVHRYLPKMSTVTFEDYWNVLNPVDRPTITIFYNEINI